MYAVVFALFMAGSAIAANEGVIKSKLRGELREQYQRSLGFPSSPFPSMITPRLGFSTDVLFTIGETINGYTPPGIPDGMGAFLLDKFTMRILVNHELLNDRGYAYDTENIQGLTGARVSFLDVDLSSLSVVNGGLAYERIFNYDGELVTSVPELLGELAGFSRFCSGRLVFPGQFGSVSKKGKKPSAVFGVEDLIYFAPEEDGGFFNRVGGNIWALDVVNQDFWQVSAFGRGAWENVSPIDTGSTQTVAFILADDSSPFDFDGDGEDDPVPMYLYVGVKDPSGNFLERNGLSGGSLYVWVSDSGETRPNEFRGTGNFIAGTWVPIDNSRNEDEASVDGSTGFDLLGFPTQGNLVLQANALGAFGFSRPEDVHENPMKPYEVVIASTGVDTYDVLESGDGADTFGTLYVITADFTKMTGQLSILYDGNTDLSRDLRSPDNLVWSPTGAICVTEDEAEEDSLTGEILFGPGATNPVEAGVVCLDASSDDVTKPDMVRIATINRNAVVDPSIDDPFAAVDTDAGSAGEWESSGILDVSSLLGKPDGSVYLINVQAHGIEDQAAPSRIVDEDLVEGGQILLLSKDIDF